MELAQGRRTASIDPLSIRKVEGRATARAALQAETDEATRRGDAPTADPNAWPEASADAAAAERWRVRHPGVFTLQSVALASADDHPTTAAALELAGHQLLPFGGRRLDVRLHRGHPLAVHLAERGWVTGVADGYVIASCPLRYPWRLVTDLDPRATAVIDHLPARARRAVRRIATMRPSTASELARTAGAEIGEALRHRYAPGRAREAAVAGAAAGTTPFAVTRYRTLRTAFRLVPEPRWNATFVDIGAGDGRVLREALRSGAASVLGRELDPMLAEMAAAAVGEAGLVEAGDALELPLPMTSEIIFLNNPFGPDAVAQLATLVQESLLARPRPLLIIYINPPTIVPFTDIGLVLVQCSPAYSMLASPAGAREAVG